MTPELTEDTIIALDDLLDAERRALLLGDLEKLSRLLEQKEALIDALKDHEMSEASQIETLSDKVNRNQELLNTALDGIRSVARRLAALRRVRASLDTYDAQGRKKVITNDPDRSVEKRA